MYDIFGQGIFIVDGEKWRHQRKLSSYEFSTRVLRDFSCSVFRRSAARLVKVVSEFSDSNGVFDMQVRNLKPKDPFLCISIYFDNQINQS